MPLMMRVSRQGTAHGDESVWTVLRCEEVMVHPTRYSEVLTDLTGEVAEIGSVASA